MLAEWEEVFTICTLSDSKKPLTNELGNEEMKVFMAHLR